MKSSLFDISVISSFRSRILLCHILYDISLILLRLLEMSYSRPGILLSDISLILLRLLEMSNSRAGILLSVISFVLLRLLEMSYSRAGILLPDM